MKSNKTKYRNYKINKPTIKAILLSIIILIILIIAFLKVPNMPYNFTLFIRLVILFLIAILVFSYLGLFVGILKAKLQISKSEKKIKLSNPYIYFRDLPNEFGVGVTSILLDSTLENEKDIVACILDLCARKYLFLSKENGHYNIKVLKDIDDKLLSNEKYIMSLIIAGEIEKINYEEWYNYSLQDGISLNLFNINDVKIEEYSVNKIMKRRIKTLLRTSIILTIILSISTLFDGGDLMNYFKTSKIFFLAAFTFQTLIIYTLVTLILAVPFYISSMFTFLKMSIKSTFDVNYKNTMENNLQKTTFGIDEIQKLYSFEAFIKDFGNFVAKKAEEVVLWDRYLSYAHIFGLTKAIMRTGYKELVENSSFKIDDMDNILLNNIIINK